MARDDVTFWESLILLSLSTRPFETLDSQFVHDMRENGFAQIKYESSIPRLEITEKGKIAAIKAINSKEKELR
jgi:hypothetical protein